MADRRPLNLARGASLSAQATRGPFKVAKAKRFGEDWPIAHYYFGHDNERGNLLVTTDRARASDLRGNGAGVDASLVAWLLTHREELIGYAAAGQQAARSSIGPCPTCGALRGVLCVPMAGEIEPGQMHGARTER